jgi:hypothetical protein
MGKNLKTPDVNDVNNYKEGEIFEEMMVVSDN